MSAGQPNILIIMTDQLRHPAVYESGSSQNMRSHSRLHPDQR
jgi:hypothetical protein